MLFATIPKLPVQLQQNKKLIQHFYNLIDVFDIEMLNFHNNTDEEIKKGAGEFPMFIQMLLKQFKQWMSV